ncbi:MULTISPECIES: hypothetical protein [unclassified Rhizobium]|uniref:hypothetical protein n=1 Tax=unclassified Rhizobium TaxID=2613769 RepID=UPI00161BBC11|nr:MULTISPECIES: hypothetical protein [unclassified Rhizobium]MBB3288142.1 hypothetical protein [Rhizobium sp. BK252]MBB3402994.1 hypothetical protein [Rhizobium sp. BK289]MBB3415571.1 hypothetical protein [Rhizobium sp. BK284]MBB3483348.1 hypothetical protein [Rhizobium sp. BK347]
MRNVEPATSPPNMLADHKGETVDFICEDCEILKRIKPATLLEEHGNQTMPSLLSLVAKSLGCKRTENAFYDRCKMHFHFSPDEWARRMGYIDPKAQKKDTLSFSDLREWHRLYAHCPCGRKSEVEPKRLEKVLGTRAPIADAARLLRCKKCGVKGMAKIVVVSQARG